MSTFITEDDGFSYVKNKKSKEKVVAGFYVDKNKSQYVIITENNEREVADYSTGYGLSVYNVKFIESIDEREPVRLSISLENDSYKKVQALATLSYKKNVLEKSK